ncbi:MAG: hypothetical protein H7835_03525 [Magnetococcus sp. XQGC-1]
MGIHADSNLTKSVGASMDAVDEQLRTNHPPETKQTYNRLLAQGYSDQDARRLIASVVASESFMVLTHEERFDLARYTATLRNLPRVPLSCAWM